mgnify:CR=1 FL=1
MSGWRRISQLKQLLHKLITAAECESVQSVQAEHVRLSPESQLKQLLHKLIAVAEWASVQSAQAVHVRLAPDFAAEAAPTRIHSGGKMRIRAKRAGGACPAIAGFAAEAAPTYRAQV